MDRGEGAIRWSPTQARDEFLTLDFHYRIIDRYKATGKAAPEQFDYEQVSKSTDFQVVKAFDWSPKVSGLVAIGGKDGEVQLLRIDDNSNDSIVLPLKLQRTCQAVAFNTTGLLAVGLDRVRNGECLQIWDVDQRLSKWDPSKKGWQSSVSASNEPLYRLEPSVSVTSVRFFEDQPQTLVVGIKNQSLRIHDLRGMFETGTLPITALTLFPDPHGAVASFQTRCNNNLAIDHADPNYFASTALDQPSVMIWDRRATSRQSASKMYLEAVDDGEVPFGCALKLKSAIDSRNGANIRSLRYCRDRRGYLAVLSSAGELQVLCTQREYVEPLSESDVDESPELLEVKTSHTLQHPYFDENFNCRYDDRIGSSDWASLGSPDFQPRLITRRCNQKIEVMLMPTAAQHLAFDLINFSAKANSKSF
jgi:WD40 repeat protein